MPYGPQGEKSWMAVSDELPACVVENGVKQAIGGGELKASGGLGLLRMGYPPQMKSEGVVDGVLLRMRWYGVQVEGVGVYVPVGRIACIDMNLDEVMVNSVAGEWNHQLIGAETAPKHRCRQRFRRTAVGSCL